jgi:ligand-binding SRPBCC domain-containing protein
MTVQGTARATIQAPPEVVWPWIANLDKHAEYSPKPYRVVLVSGPPGAVGATYKSVGAIPGDKNHENSVEITESVPSSRFALRAEDKLGVFTNTYELRPVDGGTEVTHTLVFPKMSGLPGLMAPLLFPIIGQRDIDKRMAMLKTKVESGS